MPKIFTDCLVTDQPIDTGIEVDDASYSRLPIFLGKVFCPYCGTEHEWTKDRARLVDTDKQQSDGARAIAEARR